jgi:hypothetical protein
MATSKTVATRTAAVKGPGTLLQVTINTPPSTNMGKVSLHDCSGPHQVGAHNEVWPRGAGRTIMFAQGLTVHAGDSNGQVTVVTA